MSAQLSSQLTVMAETLIDANAVDVAVKFPRQALHSWRIAFRQPRTGRELAIEAPLPADMKALAEAVGLPA